MVLKLGLTPSISKRPRRSHVLVTVVSKESMVKFTHASIFGEYDVLAEADAGDEIVGGRWTLAGAPDPLRLVLDYFRVLILDESHFSPVRG